MPSWAPKRSAGAIRRDAVDAEARAILVENRRPQEFLMPPCMSGSEPCPPLLPAVEYRIAEVEMPGQETRLSGVASRHRGGRQAANLA